MENMTEITAKSQFLYAKRGVFMQNIVFFDGFLAISLSFVLLRISVLLHNFFSTFCAFCSNIKNTFVILAQKQEFVNMQFHQRLKYSHLFCTKRTKQEYFLLKSAHRGENSAEPQAGIVSKQLMRRKIHDKKTAKRPTRSHRGYAPRFCPQAGKTSTWLRRAQDDRLE